MKDFQRFAEMQIVDCHTHLMHAGELESLWKTERRWGIDRVNVMSIVSYEEQYMANNLLCLMFKLLHPGKAYAFGSLHYPPPNEQVNGKNFLDQVDHLIGMGFDGMKMMEGKPDVRKRTGIPLDSPVYDKYYNYLEEKRLPLLYHVNDPAIFWDKDNIPAVAVEKNWAYLDDSFVSKEGLYQEVEGILRKHPKLRVIFAHFYFMDEESIERASAFLDRWPEVAFDLAPGLLFTSFAKNAGRWREFFTKYRDRILFGTDNDYGIAKELIYAIRTVLETDSEIEYWETALHGMHLDVQILKKIYRDNFLTYAAVEPKNVDLKLFADECSRISVKAEFSPAKDTILQDVLEVQKLLKDLKENV